jgi:hypothetical protein
MVPFKAKNAVRSLDGKVAGIMTAVVAGRQDCISTAPGFDSKFTKEWEG